MTQSNNFRNSTQSSLNKTASCVFKERCKTGIRGLSLGLVSTDIWNLINSVIQLVTAVSSAHLGWKNWFLDIASVPASCCTWVLVCQLFTLLSNSHTQGKKTWTETWLSEFEVKNLRSDEEQDYLEMKLKINLWDAGQKQVNINKDD